MPPQATPGEAFREIGKFYKRVSKAKGDVRPPKPRTLRKAKATGRVQLPTGKGAKLLGQAIAEQKRTVQLGRQLVAAKGKPQKQQQLLGLPKQSGFEKQFLRSVDAIAKTGVEFATDPLGVHEIEKRKGKPAPLPLKIAGEAAALALPAKGAVKAAPLIAKAATKATKGSTVVQRGGLMAREISAGVKAAKGAPASFPRIERVREGLKAAHVMGREAKGARRVARAAAKEARREQYAAKGAAGKVVSQALRRRTRYGAAAAGLGAAATTKEGRRKEAAFAEGVGRALLRPETYPNFGRTIAASLGGLATQGAALGVSAHRLASGESFEHAMEPTAREGKKFWDSTVGMVKEYASGDPKRVEKIGVETGLLPVFAMGLGASAGVRAGRRAAYKAAGDVGKLHPSIGAAARHARGEEPTPVSPRQAGKVAARYGARGRHQAGVQTSTARKNIGKALRSLPTDADRNLILVSLERGISGEAWREAARNPVARQQLVERLQRIHTEAVAANEAVGIQPKAIPRATMKEAVRQRLRGVQDIPQAPETTVVQHALNALGTPEGRNFLAGEKFGRAVDTTREYVRATTSRTFSEKARYVPETAALATEGKIPTPRERQELERGAAKEVRKKLGKEQRSLEQAIPAIQRDIQSTQKEQHAAEQIAVLGTLRKAVKEAPVEVVTSATTQRLLDTVLRSERSARAARAAELIATQRHKTLPLAHRAHTLTPMLRVFKRLNRLGTRARARGAGAGAKLPLSRKLDQARAREQRTKTLARIDKRIEYYAGRAQEAAPTGAKRSEIPPGQRIRTLEQRAEQAKARREEVRAAAADELARSKGKMPPSIWREKMDEAARTDKYQDRHQMRKENPERYSEQSQNVKRIYSEDQAALRHAGYTKDVEAYAESIGVSTENLAYVPHLPVREWAGAAERLGIAQGIYAAKGALVQAETLKPRQLEARRNVLIHNAVRNLDAQTALTHIFDALGAQVQVETLIKTIQHTAFSRGGKKLFTGAEIRAMLDADPRIFNNYQIIPVGTIGQKAVLYRQWLENVKREHVTFNEQVFETVLEGLGDVVQTPHADKHYFILPKKMVEEAQAWRKDPERGKLWHLIRGMNTLSSVAVLGTSPNWLAAQFVAESLPGMLMNPYRMITGALAWHKLPEAQKEAVRTMSGAGISPIHVAGEHGSWGLSQNKAITMGHRFMDAIRETRIGNLLIDQHGPVVLLDRMKGGYIRNVTYMASVDKLASSGIVKNLGKWYRGHDQFLRDMPTNKQARIEYLLKNEGFLEAQADRLIDLVGDWSTYTLRERHWAALIFFYPFIRYSLRFTFYSLPKTSPMRAALLLQLGNVNREALEDLWGGQSNFLTDYMQAAINSNPRDPNNNPFMLNLSRLTPMGNAAIETGAMALNPTSTRSLLAAATSVAPPIGPLGPIAYTLYTGKDAFTDLAILPPGWSYSETTGQPLGPGGETQTPLSARLKATEYQLLRLNPISNLVAYGDTPQGPLGTPKEKTPQEQQSVEPVRRSIAQKITETKRGAAVKRFTNVFTPSTPLVLKQHYIQHQAIITANNKLSAKIAPLKWAESNAARGGAPMKPGDRAKLKLLTAQRSSLWDKYTESLKVFDKHFKQIVSGEKQAPKFDIAAAIRAGKPKPPRPRGRSGLGGGLGGGMGGGLGGGLR